MSCTFLSVLRSPSSESARTCGTVPSPSAMNDFCATSCEEDLVGAHKEVTTEPQRVNLFSPAAVDHLPSAVVLGFEGFSMKDRMQPGDLPERSKTRASILRSSMDCVRALSEKMMRTSSKYFVMSF